MGSWIYSSNKHLITLRGRSTFTWDKFSHENIQYLPLQLFGGARNFASNLTFPSHTWVKIVLQSLFLYCRWKRYHQMFSFWALTSQEYCSLCERLHTDNTTKAYDMYKWYVQDAHCKSKSSPDIYDFINAASRISGPNLTLYFVMPYLFVTMFFLYSPSNLQLA